MGDMRSDTKMPFPWAGLIMVCGLLLLELLAINALRHIYGFECYTEELAFCEAAKSLIVASYGLGATLIILAFFARSLFADLLAEAGIKTLPVAVNLTGLAVLAASLPLLRMELSVFQVVLLAGLWLVAIVMVIGGALLMFAPRARWRAFLGQAGWTLPAAALAGTAAPFIGLQMQSTWSKGALADWTFVLVTQMMEWWGQPIETFPDNKIIGAEGFFVNIAPACSGIEGLVLTTVFALIYVTLFRADLRFPQALLILPVALLASWLLNAVRISILIQIGISGQPELAVGGFHSHAGWLMFTLLSLTIVLTTHALPFLKKRNARPSSTLPPFWSDPVVAQIMPFFVFMASALLASTFAADPANAYPARALAMFLGLALVWRYFRTLPWRLDPVAVGVGIFIAIYWVVLSDPPENAAAYAEAGALWAAVWVFSRVVGTTLLVPLIEEVFFRGYLMDRLGPEGSARWRIVLSVVVTTALFAALHDRWIEAAIAGVLFAWLKLRRGNISDPIIGHIVANGLIAGWAIATGNWGAI